MPVRSCLVSAHKVINGKASASLKTAGRHRSRAPDRASCAPGPKRRLDAGPRRVTTESTRSRRHLAGPSPPVAGEADRQFPHVGRARMVTISRQAVPVTPPVAPSVGSPHQDPCRKPSGAQGCVEASGGRPLGSHLRPRVERRAVIAQERRGRSRTRGPRTPPSPHPNASVAQRVAGAHPGLASPLTPLGRVPYLPPPPPVPASALPVPPPVPFGRGRTHAARRQLVTPSPSRPIGAAPHRPWSSPYSNVVGAPGEGPGSSPPIGAHPDLWASHGHLCYSGNLTRRACSDGTWSRQRAGGRGGYGVGSWGESYQHYDLYMSSLLGSTLTSCHDDRSYNRPWVTTGLVTQKTRHSPHIDTIHSFPRRHDCSGYGKPRAGHGLCPRSNLTNNHPSHNPPHSTIFHSTVDKRVSNTNNRSTGFHGPFLHLVWVGWHKGVILRLITDFIHNPHPIIPLGRNCVLRDQGAKACLRRREAIALVSASAELASDLSAAIDDHGLGRGERRHLCTTITSSVQSACGLLGAHRLQTLALVLHGPSFERLPLEWSPLRSRDTPGYASTRDGSSKGHHIPSVSHQQIVDIAARPLPGLPPLGVKMHCDVARRFRLCVRAGCTLLRLCGVDAAPPT